MKSPSVAVFLLAVLAAAGCRVDPNIQLLERDLRRQDMKMYQLGDKIAQYQAELESCRRENASLRRQLEESKQGKPGWPDNRMQTPEVTLPGGSGGSEGPAVEPAPPGGLRVPEVEIPGTQLPPGELPESFQPPETPKPSSLPGPAPDGPAAGKPGDQSRTGPPEIGGPVAATDDNKNVSHIELGAALTGGYNADHRGGDEGVEILLVPRDAEGGVVRAAAPVSVVVGDPELPGPNPYVARWDFSAEETARLFEKTLFGEGMHLTMLWPVDSPEHRKLRLFVRYTTDDGRKLEADRDITVELTGRVAGDWMPVKRGDSTDPPQPVGEKPQSPDAGKALSQLADETPPSAAEPPPKPEIVQPTPQTAANADLPRQPSRPRPVWSPER